LERGDLIGIQDLSGLKAPGLKPPSQSFSNLFTAYARAKNRAYDRTGALFQWPLGRIPVTSDADFTALVCTFTKTRSDAA
jgi:hypothetical protein